MNRIRSLSTQEYFDFVSTELNGITDIQLFIIKSHILLEYTINCYLEAISLTSDSNFFNERFTFYQKVMLFKHFGKYEKVKPFIVRQLQLVNKLRNDIAHSLTYNEQHLIEMYTEMEKIDATVLKSETSHFGRFGLTVHFLIAALLSAYKYETDPDDIDNWIDNVKYPK